MKHLFSKSMLSVIIFSAIFCSCEKEEELLVTTPTVATNETVAEISHKSAKITGEITSNGGADISAKGIVWGTSSNPTLSDSFTVDENLEMGTFTHTLNELEPETQYYARAYATNSEGTTYGNEVSFTTEKEVIVTTPTVATNETVAEISHKSAKITGEITSNGGADISAKGIVWGTSSNPTLSDSFTVDENLEMGTFTHTLNELEPETQYYARAYATNSEGTTYGNEVSFTTAEVPNHFTFQEVEYELNAGTLLYVGNYWGMIEGYNLIIYLYSSSINWVEEESDIEGQGEIITLSLYSATETEFSGIYAFDSEGTAEPNTFDYGYFAINCDLENETADAEGVLFSGTITIDVNESIYEITISGTDDSDNQFTGYYQGELNFVEFAFDWKKGKTLPNYMHSN